MTKKQLFFAMTIITPIIFFLSYYWKDIDWSLETVEKPPPRPMVELTDEQLSQIYGQAGIHFVNENFNIQITPDDVTTLGDFQEQLLQYMINLQDTDPANAMQTYADMIVSVNNNSNPNLIPGPGTTHYQIELQHVMENVIVQGVDFMTTAASDMGFGTFGIQGLEVHMEGTFHLFVRND